jgi:hypothetical protein
VPPSARPGAQQGARLLDGTPGRRPAARRADPGRAAAAGAAAGPRGSPRPGAGWGKVVEQERDGPVHPWGAHDVVVVEDQQPRAARRRGVVDKSGQQGLRRGRRPVRPEQRPHGADRCSAAWTYRRSRYTSWSPSSSASQATGRSSSATQVASKLVLPAPAGADRSVHVAEPRPSFNRPSAAAGRRDPGAAGARTPSSPAAAGPRSHPARRHRRKGCPSPRCPVLRRPNPLDHTQGTQTRRWTVVTGTGVSREDASLLSRRPEVGEAAVDRQGRGPAPVVTSMGEAALPKGSPHRGGSLTCQKSIPRSALRVTCWWPDSSTTMIAP